MHGLTVIHELLTVVSVRHYAHYAHYAVRHCAVRVRYCQVDVAHSKKLAKRFGTVLFVPCIVLLRDRKVRIKQAVVWLHRLG